ncbi:MAG TPA: hypothetical protein VGV91_07585 [Rubrobacter sp.]|nr:hypothetical protein [Rubrobacter sp.]
MRAKSSGGNAARRVKYRASAAGPKTASYVPRSSSGEATGAPQSTTAIGGAVNPTATSLGSPSPVRTPQ